MEEELVFRTDLYQGTAPYYDRYRPPYPDGLFDDLCRRLPVSGSGRLLDMACGTGQIAIPLAGRFAEVVAVDQETESVDYGRAKAAAAGLSNITWTAGSAETVEVEGPFELVAVGNAFHRLNRPVVAARMRSWLQPGGGVALVWGDTPRAGDQPWQRGLAELFDAWMSRLGVTDRVPAGWKSAMDSHPSSQVLTEAGFEYLGRFAFEVEQTWTIETLTGLVYSTSFLNRKVLGDHVARFEQDVADLLSGCDPSGVFHEPASYAYELARTPA